MQFFSIQLSNPQPPKNPARSSSVSPAELETRHYSKTKLKFEEKEVAPQLPVVPVNIPVPGKPDILRLLNK